MGSQIWRYLDLARFIHLISTKTLHFTRIDQFKDKFEGSYPLKNIQDWENQYTEVGNFKNWRKFVCVSCWYKSDKESTAMWELYGANGQGIAIYSSKQRLEESLNDFSITYEDIKYIDFINDKADILTPLDIWKYKRIEFKYECEFRAALTLIPQSHQYKNGFPVFGSVDNQEGFPKEGRDIPVKLDILIEKVAFSPYVEKWYRSIVTEIASHYGLDTSVITTSELAIDPIYPKQ
jgi:hypothetical protein